MLKTELNTEYSLCLLLKPGHCRFLKKTETFLLEQDTY